MDLRFVGVDACHLVAEVGEAHARSQTDIAGSDDGNNHKLEATLSTLTERPVIAQKPALRYLSTVQISSKHVQFKRSFSRMKSHALFVGTLLFASASLFAVEPIGDHKLA